MISLESVRHQILKLCDEVLKQGGPRMSRLDDYREVVPKGTVDFLKCLAEQVRGRKILHINSTKLGGGVAEMLSSDVPLLQDLGVDARMADHFRNRGVFQCHEVLPQCSPGSGPASLAADARGVFGG